MIAPSAPAATIGLIGLGLMGSAFAGRLLAGGFAVLGCDIDPAKREALNALGGRGVARAQEVFQHCDRVILSLPSHREAAQVIAAGDGVLRPGQIVIDTTTGDPEPTAALAGVLAARGVTYLDATVSGSSAQVRGGAVTLMVGGNAAAFAQCADVFACIGRQAFHTGAAGTGAKMKLVTNLVLGLNRAALAEGLALAESLDLNLEQTLAVMRACPAYSRIMDTKGERMIHGDFAPDARLSQHLKDVRLIVETGQQAGLPMPLSAAHRAVLEAAEAAGWGERDNSAIIQALRAPVTRPVEP
ncbi:NAD(P)-dependent oxidoreductase [Horticoccus sp. 23ND18S-11]|uniref:NAD(P)-dependent oxidoreductase n=1 Tax=Horticoccus sp. 23ND18S-11 TaxID=3391832 RepID=UPI0039C993B7